jgi:deazaflavin-dependent oxidoreductase (nitroreductase family)
MAGITDFNRSLIEEFRAKDGRVEGSFEGTPLLLLTTTGAKSGQQHTTPLVYQRDGDRVVIFGSKGGAPAHPAWFHNLVANPEVIVELPGEKFTARAAVAEGAERQRLWERQKVAMPNFADYEAKTTREIPAIVLERAS